MDFWFDVNCKLCKSYINLYKSQEKKPTMPCCQRIPQRRHVELVANTETGSMDLKKARVCMPYRGLCACHEVCPVRDCSAPVGRIFWRRHWSAGGIFGFPQLVYSPRYWTTRGEGDGDADYLPHESMGQSSLCLFMLISCLLQWGWMDEILSQKPVLKEDYYAILGCDELSTVRLYCYIMQVYCIVCFTWSIHVIIFYAIGWRFRAFIPCQCKVRLVNLRIWPNAQRFWPVAFDKTVLPVLAEGKNTNTKLIFWEGLQCQIHSELTAMKK